MLKGDLLRALHFFSSSASIHAQCRKCRFRDPKLFSRGDVIKISNPKYCLQVQITLLIVEYLIVMGKIYLKYI
jgi:hypothetical protein